MEYYFCKLARVMLVAHRLRKCEVVDIALRRGFLVVHRRMVALIFPGFTAGNFEAHSNTCFTTTAPA